MYDLVLERCLDALPTQHVQILQSEYLNAHPDLVHAVAYTIVSCCLSIVYISKHKPGGSLSLFRMAGRSRGNGCIAVDYKSTFLTIRVNCEHYSKNIVE